jgi:hypothetical protein
MLTIQQRSWLFKSFMAFVLLCVIVEIWAFVSFANAGKIGALEGALAALGVSGLGLSFGLYREMIKREFLTPAASMDGADDVPRSALASYFQNREDAIRSRGMFVDREACRSITVELLRTVLRFMEAILRTWIGPHRFELSIFANPDAPEIICYYDSDGHIQPRSAGARRADPNYYRKKEYEVVELLDRPSNRVHVIPHTEEDEEYTFVTERQRRVIKSTILATIPFDQPLVLVIVCNQERSFSEEYERVKRLLTTLGRALRAELEFEKRLPVR